MKNSIILFNIFRTDLTYNLSPTCFIKRFHNGIIYQASDTVAYSLLLLMTPFLLSNRNDRGSGTISCCERLKIPLTCWSRQIQSKKKKGWENNSVAQKDKDSSQQTCVCISYPICIYVCVFEWGCTYKCIWLFSQVWT